MASNHVDVRTDLPPETRARLRVLAMNARRAEMGGIRAATREIDVLLRNMQHQIDDAVAWQRVERDEVVRLPRLGWRWRIARWLRSERERLRTRIRTKQAPLQLPAASLR